MKYYCILLLGLLGIFVPIPIAMWISNLMGNYWWGALFLLPTCVFVFLIYKKNKAVRGVFPAAFSILTAVFIVMLGMVYAGITGIFPS